MFLSLLLSRLFRAAPFAWSPSLDLHDPAIRSTLIAGVQY